MAAASGVRPSALPLTVTAAGATGGHGRVVRRATETATTSPSDTRQKKRVLKKRSCHLVLQLLMQLFWTGPPRAAPGPEEGPIGCGPVDRLCCTRVAGRYRTLADGSSCNQNARESGEKQSGRAGTADCGTLLLPRSPTVCPAGSHLASLCVFWVCMCGFLVLLASVPSMLTGWAVRAA